METPTTADIWMRLMVPVPGDQSAGRLMEAVETAVRVALADHDLTGSFEFVRFNTHTRETAQAARPAGELATPMPDGEPF